MSLSQAILDDFEAELTHTRNLLDAVPEDRGEWKPHDKSMSLAQLAGHLAETPSWTGAMLEDEMDFADMAGDWVPFVSSERKELRETLDKNARAMREMLDGRDDDFMRAKWTMRKGAEILLEQPRHEVIRSTILHHTAHHRGQLTVYLRLLDVPVPMTYGSTADHSMF